MSTGNIPLFELDVAVPSQLYMIEYSVVEKGGLPFVPDFLLKLLHVADFLPQEVARFFGFSRKELDFALMGFFKSGEVEYRKDGKLGLTTKGYSLFSDNETSPMRESIKDYRKSFCFDLLTFSYLGSRALPDKALRAFQLKVDGENWAESQVMAKDSFQRNIHEIYKKGHLTQQDAQGNTPEIYKLSDCSKRKDFFSRIPEVFSLNSGTYQFEFDDREGLGESDAYIRARTEQLSAVCGTRNLDQIAKLADMLEDDLTLRILDHKSLNAERLASLALDDLQSLEVDSERRRLYGSLQIKRNWDIVLNELKAELKADNSEKLDLTWVAPSCHELWGKTDRHGQALSELYQVFAGKKSGKSDFSVYVPLPDDRNKAAKALARRENAEAAGRVHGFVESEQISSVEIMMLKGRFVVVLYHYTDPKHYPAPIPFGFISRNKADLNRVEALVTGVLNEYTAAGSPRDLGRID